MTGRIDTKAVLEKANGGTTRLIGNIRVDKPQGWCRWCQAPMDEHDEDCPVPALAQEVADQEADRGMRQQYLLETIELRDANAALEARIKALVAGLMRFGDHPRDCHTWQVGLMNATKEDCDCGLWALIGYEPAPAAEEKKP